MKDNLVIDYAHQATELPGTKRPGQTGIYRRAGFEDGLCTIPHNSPETKTMHDAFMRGIRQSANEPFLGKRAFDPITKKHGEYQWETYNEVEQHVKYFGSGLVHLHTTTLNLAQAARQWAVGILAISRREWTITGLACDAFDLVSVGLYDTLGPDAVNYSLEHSECPVVVAMIDHVESLLKDSAKLPTLRIIVSMDSLASEQGKKLRQLAKTTEIQLYEWNEVEDLGSRFTRPYTPALPSSVFTHCYTSGTTGNPKAAVLRHSNVITMIANSAATAPLDHTDVCIGFLPQPHIYGRMVEMAIMFNGGRIGHSVGNPLTLMDDIQVLKPTYFPSVPRLLNRLHANLSKALLAGPPEKVAFAKKALATKLENLKNGKGNVHKEYDEILFSKLKQVIGGRVRFILVGSAPIPADVLAFLRVVFSCDINEGYGQTEGCGGACGTLLGESTAGHVGPPSAANELKLVDVPELNYFATDKPFPRGEICIRGTNVFTEYYKDEKKTRETIDSEGWLHSGDVAFIDDCGRVTIIDRIKNVFKLAQGEFVAVERIENCLTVNIPILQQMMVHGVRTESFLVSVGIPEPDLFIPFTKQVLKGEVGVDKIDGLSSLKPFLNHPKLRKAVTQLMTDAGKKTGLKGFEIPKAILLLADPFTIENDMLTPTSKVKRQAVVQNFGKELNDMYVQTNAAIAKL